MRTRKSEIMSLGVPPLRIRHVSQGVYSCALRGVLLRPFLKKGVYSCAFGGVLLRHHARVLQINLRFIPYGVLINKT
jgi:hypothetical protein